ncbi:putative N-acetyltransferase YycN [compost metagenome]
MVRGPESDRRAWIADIVVEEEYRGKGYGRRVMLLLEQEVKAMGLNKIGLHVFGFNESAIKLYQSMGYLATDLMMEKVLS